MRKSLSAWQLGGFLFTSILGTFLHFLFDLSGGNPIVAIFSAVNESIWEHMKLIFYPMFLFSIIEWYKIGRNIPNFWCIKLIGDLIALTLIPIIYYTYTGIFGISVDWFNITIFFISAAAAYYLEYSLFSAQRNCLLSNAFTFTVILLIVLIFGIFTFRSPKIPLFQDPQTGSYGYQKTLPNRQRFSITAGECPLFHIQRW